MTGAIEMGSNAITSAGDLLLDVAGDIILDADGDDIQLKAGAFHFASITKPANNGVEFRAIGSDRDMFFKGNDGGSEITALTFDMSNGGRANFNNDIALIDNRGLRLGSDDDSVIYNDGSNLYIKNGTLNQDIIFQGNDDGSNITALTLDMSDAGTATFNHDVKIPDNGFFVAGAGSDLRISSNGTDGTIDTANGHMNLDSAGQIFLDAADDGNVQLRNTGTQYGAMYSTSGDWYFKSTQGDKDIIFQGVDNTSQIAALTLDMSDAGTAIFSHDVKLPDNGKAIFAAGS